MEVIRIPSEPGVRNFKLELGSKTCTGVTIGNFDGMHIGHQTLFGELRSRLQTLALDRNEMPLSVIFTFYPHPRRIFSGLSRRDVELRPDYSVLTSLRRKIQLAEEFGFDIFCVLRFHKGFACISADDFVRHYLVNLLKSKLIIVGHDWTFGTGGAGSVELLEKLGRKHDFATSVIDPVVGPDGRRISSRRARLALARGELSSLRSLLGRNFELSARVRHGEQRGRSLGFPTANLEFYEQLLPMNGVYATIVSAGSLRAMAVTNVGTRPTFDGTNRLVEVHLLDNPALDLYNSRLNVEFVERIRAEKKFASKVELQGAIQTDISKARAILQG